MSSSSCFEQISIGGGEDVVILSSSNIVGVISAPEEIDWSSFRGGLVGAV